MSQTQTTSPAARRKLYFRILKHMRSYWRGLGVVVLLSLLGSALIVLNPWVVKLLLDGVLVGRSVSVGPFGTFAVHTTQDRLQAVTYLSLAYLGMIVFGVLTGALGVFVVAKVALHMIQDLRSRLVSHMGILGLRYHANVSVGDSIWRAINDAREIQNVVLFFIQMMTIPLFQFTMRIGLMFLLDPVLTLVVLVIFPPLVFAIRRFTTRIQQMSLMSRERMSDMTALIERMLVAIRAVQVFGRERDEHDKFMSTSGHYISAQLRFRTWEQGLNVSTVVLTGLGSATVLMLASRGVVQGRLSVGSLFVFVSYMQGFYQVINQVMQGYGLFQDSVVGVGRVFEVLDEEPDIREAPDAIDKTTFESGLAMRHVGFEYDEGRPVLQDIDLEVRRGEQIAIVGETGSGKTTLISLIPRLYEVTSGAVEIDGIDIRRLKLASMRGLMSMVPQEPLLFSATVRENISYGRIDASVEEIQVAARAARAEGFISELRDGYDTHVGERGVKLSTGQQQRISIARAFLKDAPILFLDEPTSALDLNTEADFLDGMADLMVGRTVFIVAHRLSTIRNADRIVVLDAGRIVELGTHDELMALEGRYHSLYIKQFRSGEVVV